MSGVQRGIKDLPLDNRIRLHFDLVDTGILPSCMNCEHNKKHYEFVMQDRALQPYPDTFCTKYKSVPPINVIVCGCPGWGQAIPF